jgi:hypothetical protein
MPALLKDVDWAVFLFGILTVLIGSYAGACWLLLRSGR